MKKLEHCKMCDGTGLYEAKPCHNCNGDGHTFSKDVSELTRWVLDNYEENEPIILSTSEEISIKELVGLVVEIMNFKGIDK